MTTVYIPNEEEKAVLRKFLSSRYGAVAIVMDDDAAKKLKELGVKDGDEVDVSIEDPDIYLDVINSDEHSFIEELVDMKDSDD